MIDPDRPCPHENFDALVVVNRLEDSGAFVVDARVDCRDCGDPFLFPDDVPIGANLNGVARSFDGRELRVGIRPDTPHPGTLSP